MPSFSNPLSKTMSDTESTYSSVSTATTLKGDAQGQNSKWYSSFSKSSKSSKAQDTDSSKKIEATNKQNHQKQLHREAVASYLSMR